MNRKALTTARAAIASLAFGVFLSVAAPASAQDAPAAGKEPLSIVLTLHRITTAADGTETAVPAETAKGGDLLEYRAVYRNDGASRLGGLLATLPIPAGLEYQARSASPGPALAAAADGAFAAEPLQRKVRDAAGRETTETVPYADYRALRWVVDSLEPGKSFTVSARVRVADGTAPTPVR